MISTPALQATARSQVYAFLAQALLEPDAPGVARLRQMLRAVEAALAALDAAQSRAALAQVRRTLDGVDADALAAAYRRIFGHIAAGDCPPYEGEYGNAHIFQKTQCLADNAGFLAAFRLAVAPGFTDRLDHIAVELEFMHVLAAKESYALSRGHGEERLALVREAARKYLRDHLGRWAFAFAARLERKAQDGPYAALARLLAAFLAEETLALDVEPVPATLVAGEPQPDEAEPCGGCAAAFNPSIRVEP